MSKIIHFSERIVSNPDVLLGKPVVLGTRIPVYLIIGLVEAGQSAEEIVDDYPNLTVEDIAAAIEFDEQERYRTIIRAL